MIFHISGKQLLDEMGIGKVPMEMGNDIIICHLEVEVENIVDLDVSRREAVILAHEVGEGVVPVG